MAGDAVETLVAEESVRAIAHLRLGLALRRGEFDEWLQLVGLREKLREICQARFAELRHARLHVGADDGSIVEDFPHPLRAQLRAGEGERRRDARLIAERFLGGVEKVIELR